MNSDTWYEQIASNESLTQGDIILNCPILRWDEGIDFQISDKDENEILKKAVSPISVDVVIMTQACDLEQNKVSNVVLCPHFPLSSYKIDWENSFKDRGQNPTARSWRNFCDDIKNGYIWNLSLLNSEAGNPLSTEVRVVDFHEVYTVPRLFLDNLVKHRKQPRLRLNPPYREHLSQAFARYFMRVGLPIPITVDL